jgi:hypothetical protein
MDQILFANQESTLGIGHIPGNLLHPGTIRCMYNSTEPYFASGYVLKK